MKPGRKRRKANAAARAVRRQAARRAEERDYQRTMWELLAGKLELKRDDA